MYIKGINHCRLLTHVGRNLDVGGCGSGGENGGWKLSVFVQGRRSSLPRSRKCVRPQGLVDCSFDGSRGVAAAFLRCPTDPSRRFYRAEWGL